MTDAQLARRCALWTMGAVFFGLAACGVHPAILTAICAGYAMFYFLRSCQPR